MKSKPRAPLFSMEGAEALQLFWSRCSPLHGKHGKHTASRENGFPCYQVMETGGKIWLEIFKVLRRSIDLAAGCMGHAPQNSELDQGMKSFLSATATCITNLRYTIKIR